MSGRFIGEEILYCTLVLPSVRYFFVFCYDFLFVKDVGEKLGEEIF